MLAWYANRAGYLMAIGRPAAQVGLYHPGNTHLAGRRAATEADRSTTKLGWQLFEHQVDWDYFDEQSLSWRRDAGERRLHQPQRANLQGDRAAVDDGDHAHRTRPAARVRRRRAARSSSSARRRA